MTDFDESIQSVARAELGESESGPVHFECIRLTGDVPRSAGLVNWQAYQGTVLAVVFSTGRSHQMLGSAVMVAPGVALGADHTFQEWIPKINTGETTVTALGITTEGAVMWRVKHGVCVAGTDLSIMCLRLASKIPPQRKFYLAQITTRLPPIGEQMTVVGFRASNTVFEQRLSDTLELSGGLHRTAGPVIEHHPQRRDPLLANWPCLVADAPLYGGMSGGPVFDKFGGLVALNSRSPNLGPEIEPSPMVAGLIWPALGQPFSVSDDPAGPLSSLLQLAEKYPIIDQSSAVTISRTDSGWETNYTPWT